MKNARELIDSFNRILVDLAFGGTENEETLAYMKEMEEALTKEGYTQKPVWFLRNAQYKKVSQFKKRKVSYKASFVRTSVRPADHKEKGFPKGDCSTRAMSYVLGKDYKEVYAEQLNAGKRWNYLDGGIKEVMKPRGYVCVELDVPVVLHKIADSLKGVVDKFIAITRSHAVAVDDGKVIDTWDCRSRRVKKVIVPSDKVHLVCLNQNLGDYAIRNWE